MLCGKKNKMTFNQYLAISAVTIPLSLLGLFTIAINTGPLDPNVLKEAGADLVFTGSEELLENWPVIYDILSN